MPFGQIAPLVVLLGMWVFSGEPAGGPRMALAQALGGITPFFRMKQP